MAKILDLRIDSWTRNDRLVLRADDGAIAVELGPDRALRLDAIDRARGAAFVDAVARWLGTPLGPPAIDGPVRAVRGRYARRGERDGWQIIKLAFADVQMFLHLAGRRARFAEMWRPFRPALVTTLDRALGAGRLPARRDELVVAGGLAMLSIPTTWNAREIANGVRVVDPTERAELEVVCDAPEIECSCPHQRDLVFVAYDRDRAAMRPACERVLVCANELVRVTVRYRYWATDAEWAIPEWDRLVSTLELARVASRETQPALSA
jgi:hypothetical protein